MKEVKEEKGDEDEEEEEEAEDKGERVVGGKGRRTPADVPRS